MSVELRQFRGWCCFCRYDLDSPWVAAEHTYSWTRRRSIALWDEAYTVDGEVHLRARKWLYRNRRRKGLARCVRAHMLPVELEDLA